MSLLSKIWSYGIALIYTGGMLFAAYTGFTAPYNNWDMVAYTGTVIAWSNASPEVVLEKTMAEIEKSSPPQVYKKFKEHGLSDDPITFNEQLPFYRIKPLYTGLLWLVSRSGITLPQAGWLISNICFILLAVRLYCWKPQYMVKEAWLILVLCLTFFWSWPMSTLACLPTPDCLATLLQMSALYAWLMRRSFKGFAALSWLAMLARPDSLILSAFFCFYAAFAPPPEERMKLSGIMLFLVFSLLTYAFVSHYVGSYSYERFFIYSYIDKEARPAENAMQLTLPLYLHTLAHCAYMFLIDGRQVTMIVFSLMALLCYALKPAAGTHRWANLLLLVWASLIVRFLLFPAWEEKRYYFVYYLPILFSGGEMMAPFAAPRKKS